MFCFVREKNKQTKANTPSNPLHSELLQILRYHLLAASGWILVSSELLLIWGRADSEAAALPSVKELLQHRASFSSVLWRLSKGRGAACLTWSGFELCVSSQGEAGACTFNGSFASGLLACYACSLFLKDWPHGRDLHWSSLRAVVHGKDPCWRSSWRTVSSGRDCMMEQGNSVRSLPSRRKEWQGLRVMNWQPMPCPKSLCGWGGVRENGEWS